MDRLSAREDMDELSEGGSGGRDGARMEKAKRQRGMKNADFICDKVIEVMSSDTGPTRWYFI